MAKVILFFLLLFTTFSAFSQEQITDFDNILESSPNNISYKATINNKIIFTAYTPETGTELWVSDGTKEGTKLLKEFTEGKEGTVFYNFKVHQNWLYFSINADYWKTDGSVIEKSNYQVLDSLSRILGYYKQFPIVASNWKTNYGNYPFTAYTNYQLAILKSKGDSVKISERPIFSHVILEDKIYYNTYSHKDSVWSFNCYFNGTSQVIHSEKLLQMPQSIEFFKYGEHLYFKVSLLKISYSSIAALPNYQCIIQLKENTLNDYKIQKFEGNISFNKSDLNINSYFFHQKNSILEVFQLDSFKLLNTFILNQAKCSGYGSEYQNIIYSPSKLTYIVTNGSFLAYSCVFLYEHDIAKGAVRRSSNLTKIISTDRTDFQVQNINDSLYYISYKSYYLSTVQSKKVIYNLSDNSWKETDIQPIIRQDTILLLGKSIFISTNDIMTEKNESLLKKSYYNPSSSQYYIQRYCLKDKIILLRAVYGKNQYELYSSDGEKSITFLGLLKGEVQFGIGEELDGKFIFYSFTKNGDFYLYQTDGTKEHTKILYETTKSDYVRIGFFRKNDGLLTLRIIESVETVVKENYVLIVEGESIKKINIPIYLENFSLIKTEDVLWIRPYNTSYNIYKIENDSLKIYPQKFSNSLYSYKNRWYFLKPSQTFNGIYFIDKNMNEYQFLNFKEYVYHFLIIENIMVLSERVNDQRMNVIIIDLETEKEILRFESENNNSPHVLKNKHSLLIQLRNELIIIDLLKKTKQSFEVFQDSRIETFADGFLINNNNPSNFTLTYYESNLKKPIKIIDQKPQTGYIKNQVQNYLVYSEIINDRLLWRCFFPKQNSIITQTTSFEKFSTFTQHGMIGSFENKSYYYKLENGQFTKEFEVNSYNLVSIDNKDYLVFSNPNSISELAELTKDSIIYFPRIEKGTTQIYSDNVFHFRGNIYMMVNAPSIGLQIWKMGKVREQEIVLASEEENKVSIQISPNPTTEKLRIECELPSRVSLINSTGKIIKEDTFQNKEIDVQNLQTGVYLLKFQNEKGVFTRRFVKY